MQSYTKVKNQQEGKSFNSKSQKVNFRWRVEMTGRLNHRISNQASRVRVRQTAGGDCFREAVVLSETTSFPSN